MPAIHHRKLPEAPGDEGKQHHWSLVCGRLPLDDLGFKSDRLQIIYNNTNLAWKDELPHSHAHSDEVYIVLEGSMSVRVDETLVCVAAGEVLCVPAGTVHQLESVTAPLKSFVIRS